MGKDIKIFIGLTIAAVVIGFGLILRQGGDVDGENVTASGNINEIEINPNFLDLGEVAINGGIVEKVYELKNTSNQPVVLNNIVTSCMCTQANISLGDKASRYFGMEHPGDRNPNLKFEIPAGETAQITVKFDPAAHGPTGTGPFDRVVSLTFNAPAGVKELSFKGVVI